MRYKIDLIKQEPNQQNDSDKIDYSQLSNLSIMERIQLILNQ